MDQGGSSELEGSLRRVEALIAGLDRIADPAAREPARELLELVLELHTLGLARIIAIVAGAPTETCLIPNATSVSVGRSQKINGSNTLNAINVAWQLRAW